MNSESRKPHDTFTGAHATQTRVPDRKGTRVFLCFWSVACLAGFRQDPEFPQLLGLLFVAMGIAGFELYFAVGRRLYSLLLFNWLFVLTYPLYLAHLATDQTWAFETTSFDGPTYVAVIRIAMAGYAGIIAATLALACRPLPKDTGGFAPLTDVQLRRIVAVSVLFYGASLVAIYQSGVGVIGYNARPSIPFVFGFLARLGQLVVPMFNVFVIGQLLSTKRYRALRWFFVFVCLEAVGIVLVSLSRYSLLMYVGLPVVFIATKLSTVSLRRIGFGRLAFAGGVVVVAGILLAQGARNVVFDSLRSGEGYQRQSAVDADAFNVSALLGALSFFERLQGVRELMWVERGVHSPRVSDIWYSLITGPPANDPYYINRQVLAETINVNEDTGFGEGLSLFANLRFGGHELVVWAGMVLIAGMIASLEVFAGRHRLHDSLTLFLCTVLVVNLWQGLAIQTILQRPLQMYLIGLLVLWWIGGKAALARPGLGASRAAVA